NASLATDTIVALRNKVSPDFKTLPNALAAITTGDRDGKNLAGPDAFLETVKRSLKLQDDGLRALALNQALYPNQDAGTNIARLATDVASMQAQVVAALIKLIDADANRATAEDAAELHAKYLDLVAKLSSITRQQEIKDLEGALDRLAAK